MSGRYNGVLANIQTVNPLTIFIPYFAHSLNLVENSSVDCCTAAVKYFDFVQKVYTFFSASTHRWHILLVNISKHVPVPNEFPIHIGPVMLMQHEHCQRATRTFAQLFVQFRVIMKRKQLQDKKLLDY